MEFFRVASTTDRKQVGDGYPQVKFEFYSEKDIWDIEYDTNIDEYVKHGILNKNNIFSDFLSSAEFPIHEAFLINEETYKLLSRLKMPDVKVYSTKIFRGREGHQYFICMSKYDTSQYINYKKSLFIEENLHMKGAPFSVGDLSELNVKRREALDRKGGTITPEKIMLNREILDRYDVFYFPGISSRVYATTRFKNFIEEMKLTGLEFFHTSVVEME